MYPRGERFSTTKRGSYSDNKTGDNFDFYGADVCSLERKYSFYEKRESKQGRAL